MYRVLRMFAADVKDPKTKKMTRRLVTNDNVNDLGLSQKAVKRHMERGNLLALTSQEVPAPAPDSGGEG